MKKQKTKKFEYIFAKDFEYEGIRVAKGVSLGFKNVTESGSVVSVAGSDIFKDIPLEYFEKVEVVPRVHKKPRAKKQKRAEIEAKSDAENARISSGKI